MHLFKGVGRVGNVGKTNESGWSSVSERAVGAGRVDRQRARLVGAGGRVLIAADGETDVLSAIARCEYAELYRPTMTTTSRARVFAALCVLFACVVCSVQAGTTEGTGTGENNTVAATTPGLSGGSPTVGTEQGVTDGDGVTGGGTAEVVSTSAEVVSTSAAALSASTMHASSPVITTSVVDSVTTVAVIADDNDSVDDSDTDAVTPNDNPTTSSGTTQHVTDDTPSVTMSPASKIQKKTTASDNNSMMTTIADDTTQTPDDTPGGVTEQPPFVTDTDEPVATESIALDETDTRTRLQKNLGGALMPVYTMTSFFLERIVQPNDITQVDSFIITH